MNPTDQYAAGARLHAEAEELRRRNAEQDAASAWWSARINEGTR